MFNGFNQPRENWSKLPHELIDVLDTIETVGELKIILYILRHTWGYQDDQKKITLDEFENGRKHRDGTRIDNGTGLSIPTIRNGIKRAVEHGFITVETDDSDPARVKNFYSLGERNLHPDCKKLSLRVKEILPRTEKETFKKETTEREEAAPPPPQETRNVLDLWYEATGQYINGKETAVLQDAMSVHTDVEVLKKAYLLWREAKHNPTNVKGVLDWYNNLIDDANWLPYPVIKARKSQAPPLEDVLKVISKYGRGKFRVACHEAPQPVMQFAERMGKWGELCGMTTRQLEIAYHRTVGNVS